MAITVTHLVTNFNNATQASYTTASITPPANEVTFAFLFTNGNVTSTTTGNSRTWSQLGIYNGTGGRSIHGFYTYDTSAGAAGAVTFSLSGSPAGAAWSIFSLAGTDVSGTNGAGAFVANSTSLSNNAGASVSGTNTGNSVTLSALSNTNNLSMGFTRNNTANAITAGSGYTSIGSWATSGTAGRSEYLVPGAILVDFTWGSQSVISVMAAVEIKVASAVKSLALVGVG